MTPDQMTQQVADLLAEYRPDIAVHVDLPRTFRNEKFGGWFETEEQAYAAVGMVFAALPVGSILRLVDVDHENDPVKQPRYCWLACVRVSIPLITRNPVHAP